MNATLESAATHAATHLHVLLLMDRGLPKRSFGSRICGFIARTIRAAFGAASFWRFPDVGLSIGVLLAGWLVVDVQAGPLDQWHWRNPTPQGGALRSLVSTTNGFLAAGDGGFVLTSPNALSWDFVRNDSIPALQNLAFGNDLFVGVTTAGAIALSGDGLIWTNQNLANDVTFSAVAFGRGLFVGLTGPNWPGDGVNKVILTSSDGVTWTPRDAGTTNALHGITYGNGCFIAVGELGTVTSSKDGFRWKSYGTDPSTTLWAVTFGENLFAAVGAAGYLGGLIITSGNGADWNPGHLTYAPLRSVAWGNGVFVAAGGVCGKYGCNPELVSSSDGLNWTERNAQSQGRFGNVFSALAFGQGSFVAVKEDGTIFTSVDGVQWQTRNDGVRWQYRLPGEETTISAITQGAGTLVAVGGYFSPYHSASLILSSTDGVNWTDRARSDGISLGSVAFGSGIFVAAGGNGTVFTSPDGIAWAPQVIIPGTDLSQVCYGASRFVLSTSSYNNGGVPHSSIWVSEDGTNWTQRYEATNVVGFRFAHGNGLFVAASETFDGPVSKSVLLTSADGLSWTPRDLTGMGLLDVSFGHDLFVATSDNCDSNSCWRVVLTSPDGLNWTPHSSLNDPILTRLTFGQGYFAGLGQDNGLYFSTNGVQWINSHIGVTAPLENVGFGLGTFWVVGDSGAVLQSDPLVAASPSIANAPLGQMVFAGAAASLQVTATGSAPLTYQWLKDNTVITGATNATLAFRQVGLSDDGNYFLVVSNSAGAVATQPVHLSVQKPPEIPLLLLEFDPYVELTLLAKQGRSYQLQSTDDLQNVNGWQNVAVVQVPVVPFTWTDSRSAPSGSRFYRAKLLP